MNSCLSPVYVEFPVGEYLTRSDRQLVLRLLIQNECLGVAPVNTFRVRHWIDQGCIARGADLIKDLKVVFDSIY